MTLKSIGAALLMGASLLPAQALAQAATAPQPDASTRHVIAADLNGPRSQLRDARKETVAQNLRLTPDEATRFWPLYDQYAADLTKIKNDQYELIAEYANTYGKYDDKSAMSYIARWVDIDVRTTALRARYVPLVGKVLPGIKAATFIQIDRRLGMAIDLEIGRNLSILQAQNGN